MTKLTFIADGKEFATYAEAKQVSNHIESKYTEGWTDPKEAEEIEKRFAERRARLNKKI